MSANQVPRLDPLGLLSRHSALPGRPGPAPTTPVGKEAPMHYCRHYITRPSILQGPLYYKALYITRSSILQGTLYFKALYITRSSTLRGPLYYNDRVAEPDFTAKQLESTHISTSSPPLPLLCTTREITPQITNILPSECTFVHRWLQLCTQMCAQNV